MVLLCGIPGDKPFEMIADALDAIGSDYVVLNQQHFAEIHLECLLDEDELNGVLTINDHAYALSQFTGVYNRLTSWQALPGVASLPVALQQHCARLHDLLFSWMEVTQARVLNTNSAMSSNCSKPYQMLAIAKHGFKVPDTLITNQAKAILDFRDQRKQVIYKSASGVRSIVYEFKHTDENRLPMVQSCATMFQEKLSGNNIRVHIVGEKCFAHFVESEIVDYRYASKAGGNATITAYTLDERVAQSCIEMSKKLRLPLAGIDLFLTPNNEYYCFEVNPSPGFSFFEEHTGQPIAETIARFLSGSSI